MNTNIQTAYDQVRKTNLIAGQLQGNGGEADLDGIANQIEIIREEFNETVDAFFEDRDAVELVDGACDMFVTVAGLMQILEVSGVNIEKALARIIQNNLNKFPSEFEFKENPSLQPEGTVVHYSPYGHVVFKDPLINKYKKPTNFVPVDIKSCVPEDFFGVEGK